MDGTPRLRSAFPATPPRDPRDRRTRQFGRGSPTVQREPLPQIPTLKQQQPTTTTQQEQPLIPETIIDAPSQRFYAVAISVALWTWRLYDFSGLQESEEQSLWLFMKWVAIDGVFLFGLPNFRIPWLEWSTATMTLIFLAHALVDGMLMFRIPLPIGAGFAVMWRGVWGAYELAINERNVKLDSIMHNDSLILGRQVIHVLPEGSAILNPDREAFCLDDTKTQAKLPITINATNPISMEILRVDLDTQANETLRITKSQIKTMHKEASRLLSYSENPDEPKTLYYSVKKPGLYVLSKVLDESNLEVSRKQLAHTVVVPCPKAAITTPDSNKCRGDLSDVDLLAIGTPPMKVKYRRVINKYTQEATFENIQPEDLVSPLARQDHSSLIVPARIETDWVRPQSIRVPLNERLGSSGNWVYAIDEIVDGLGNAVSYTAPSQEGQPRRATKSPHLYHVITVHERPKVQFNGCTPQRPLKVAQGQSTWLPVQYSSTDERPLKDSTYHLEYLFSSPDDVVASGEQGTSASNGVFKSTNSTKLPPIKAPGLYTLTSVTSDFCQGEVLEPASCLLENPPKPELTVTRNDIFDKCAGQSIGLRVDLDLVGTPPFKIEYRISKDRARHHSSGVKVVKGLRDQIELIPNEAGHYTYEFLKISDAIYKDEDIVIDKLHQDVKPSASAHFVDDRKRVSCIDQKVSSEVALFGEAPFTLEYELVHAGKRTKYAVANVSESRLTLDTAPLRDGGDYTLALISITDSLNCKEFLQAESRIAVRHQKPKVSFGHIDGRRIVDTLEDQQVPLPLRLAGDGPWTVTYRDAKGTSHMILAKDSNDRITVDSEGMYELIDVSDNACPGVVDETAKDFQVNWIPRPELRVTPKNIKAQQGSTIIKEDVCEGDETAAEILFKGTPPYVAYYTQNVKPEHGVVTPQNKELHATMNVAPLRMDSSRAGVYEYRFSKLRDDSYKEDPKHFTPIAIQQTVKPRPSAAFGNPGKTYSFCSVESEGEEVIPVKLAGQPPFQLEVEIKHQGTIRPEILHYQDIASPSYNIRIPHARLNLGKSTLALRRVSDSNGCARTLDSTIPKVQISVHDAPSITPLETHTDYCVGDRINFGLVGVAPFTIHYTFQGAQKKASVSSGNTFRRLAEKPGEFIITGLQDSASSCKATANITKVIHGMPSVRVSKGKDSYVDIHEGGQAEILFEFGGVPPFEFTYTRSSNTEKGASKRGVVLDMKSEISDEQSLRIWASEEGTYEVVAIKDRHCAYAKPGVKVEKDKRKMLGY